MTEKPLPPGILLQLEQRVRHLRGGTTDAPEGKAALADALEQLAGVRLSLGQLLEAKQNLLEAVTLVRPSTILDDGPAKAQLADLQIKLGYLFCSLEEPSSALDQFYGAICYFENSRDNLRGLAAALNGQASAYGMFENHIAAIECLRKAAVIIEGIATSSRSPGDTAQWAMLLNNLGRAQLAAKDVPSAMKVMQHCATITQELVGASENHEHRNMHAAVTCRLGSVYEAAGRAAEAEACYRQSVNDMRHLVEDLGMRQFAHDYAYALECLKRLEDTASKS